VDTHEELAPAAAPRGGKRRGEARGMHGDGPAALAG
jgi:hypothetical protein